MTNKQAPVALRLAEEIEHDPGINRPSVVAELRRLHAENTTLQQGYDAARMEIDGLRDRVQELGAMLRENSCKRIVELEAQLEAIGAGGVEPLRRRECLHQIVEPAAATRIQQPYNLAEIKAKIASHDYSAELLLQHAMLLLEKPAAVTVPEEQNESAYQRGYMDGMAKGRRDAEAAPQQESQEPCQTCAALARTVMLDQVSFDRKPDCYGIRQVTDDEGIEEWEDIRTSPDVAREEANDMMATGRGEIYEVVPLYTAPQAAPAAQGDAEDAARYQWLADYLIGARTDIDDAILACVSEKELSEVIDADRKKGANHD